jgi:hypothetical protein
MSAEGAMLSRVPRLQRSLSQQFYPGLRPGLLTGGPAGLIRICPALLIALLFYILFAALSLYAAESSEPDPVLFGKIIHEISYASDLPINRAHYDLNLGMKQGERLTRTGVKRAIQSLYETGRF